MASDALNFTRALVGQGLGMGWGDEAEAWLRSKVGQKSYQDNLKEINQEYAKYAEENPLIAPITEFAGGVMPMAASYLGTAMTGGAAAPAAVATTARSAGALARLANQLGRVVPKNPLARGAVVGGGTGAIAGAGSAEEGSRTKGAIIGGTVGTGFGVGLPVAIRGGRDLATFARDRIGRSPDYIEKRAAAKVNTALERAGMTPAQAQAAMALDRAAGIPSTLANVSRPTVGLSEIVAAKSERAGDTLGKILDANKKGIQDRVIGQTERGIGNKGDFFQQEEDMVRNLRANANDLYDEAYKFGTVNDPTITRVLQSPKFKTFFDEAKKIADNEKLAAELRGEDASKYVLDDIFIADEAGNVALSKLPDVRTLDYIKRGMDAVVNKGYKGEGMSSAEASSLKDLKKAMVGALDKATEVNGVSAYKTARQQYAGDAEVLDALRSGMDDFDKFKPEQITRMIKNFSAAEQEAFRTGAVRKIYSIVEKGKDNTDAAYRLTGSPEMQKKLMPLFPSQAKFDLFKAALDREHQLFQEANRIMAGSPSAKRLAGIEAFDAGESAINAFVGNSVTGGWFNSLLNMAATTATKAGVSDDVAAKVAKLLSSSKPEEVAAAVKILERNSAQAQRAVENLNRGETGAIMGAAVMSPRAPEVEQERPTTDQMLSKDRANQLDTSVVDRMLEEYRKKRDGNEANIPGPVMVPAE
jgi:hypothetical protein